MTLPRFSALACLLALIALPGAAQQRFNWNDLGAAFCELSSSNDVEAVYPLLSPSLVTLIGTARRQAVRPVPARFLFHGFDAETTGCQVRTRNVALVEITRTWSGGSWTDYLVIAPERDGTMRIDDVLFATRRSDTLRARLGALLTGG